MKTRVIKTNTDSDISEAIDQAAEILDKGGLVGFPTETVYGLAVCVDKGDSLQRLAQLKQRPPGKPFTLHIANRSLLDRYVPGLSLLEQNFLSKAWPGPLTAVFQLSQPQLDQVKNNISEKLIDALYHNNSIGVRLPDHWVANQLLSAVDSPIVAPSANLADQPPPTCAEDVLSQLNGKIDLLLDSGPTRYTKPSTIVKVKNHDIEILREGVLDMGTVKRMQNMTILFVCTGNTCRSPMAQGICRAQLAKIFSSDIDELVQKGYKVMSAGVMGSMGARASAEAVEVCRKDGVDISSHKSRLLTPNLIKQADFIFTMETSHYSAVTNMAPEARARTALLVEQGGITDPIGGSIEVYSACARRIKQGIIDRLDKGLTPMAG